MPRVVVTGGNRGIGLAICERLASAGYDVLAIARRETDELAAARTKAPSIAFEPFDLANVERIPALVSRIRAEHGAIYGLVNNAGIGTEGLLSMMRVADIETLIRINTLSPILLTREIVRPMMAEGRGSIVNMSSIVASTGYSALSVYAATKAALTGFTKSLAREVGRAGITVNAVAPGFIETRMTESLSGDKLAKVVNRTALRRLPEPDDVARVVEFLMGEGGRNITGTVLTVDAGNSA
jgi:3-oxoacyl-[acyl-carrier protein] reductase